MRRLKNTGKNFWRGLKKGELKGEQKGVPRVLQKKRYRMQGVFLPKVYRRRLLQNASDFRSRR